MFTEIESNDTCMNEMDVSEELEDARDKRSGHFFLRTVA